MRATRPPQVLAHAQDLYSEISDADDMEWMLEQLEELLAQVDNSQQNVEVVDVDPPIEAD